MKHLRAQRHVKLTGKLPEKLYLPVLAFAAEIILSRGSFPEWFVFPIEYGLLFWFVLSNIKRRGAWPHWIGAGTLLNITVISINGFRMPVWPSFFAGSGDAELLNSLQNGDIFGYTLVDASTRLPFLADVIGFSFYGDLIGFASLGDLVLLAGAGILLYRTIRDNCKRCQTPNTN